MPTTLGQQTVLIKGYVDRIYILCEQKVVAEHARVYEKERVILNPLHYLTLLERKASAFHQAAPLKGWQLPSIFEKVQRALERRAGKEGIRSYIRILKLLETYTIKEVEASLQQAIQLDLVNEMAIIHLVKRHVEKRTEKLPINRYPHIPIVYVAPVNLAIYSQLAAKGE